MNAEQRRTVFVIIPVFNEAAIVAETLSSVMALGYSVIAVDDGSSDGSWDSIGKAAVHRIRHSINLGQGAALQTGTEFALKTGARFIVHFDADGQHSPRDIEEMIAPLECGSADIVLGSRFLKREDASAVPLKKRVLLRAGILVNYILTGLWLSDAHNGFRALSRDAAEKIVIRENGYAHATEILGQIHSLKLRVVERPTAIRYTQYSQAKGQSMLNAINILIDLILGKVL